MSEVLGTYSFLPWLRQGLANQISEHDDDPSVKLRAGVKVELELSAERIPGGTDTVTVPHEVKLYGPGDIVGLEERAIVRVEPRRDHLNVEPNYLAHIEFYDEDLPWRYTPAAPNPAGRLRPWIMLVVLAEGEFKDGKDARDKPLPYIDVPLAATLFPPAGQLAAWAHVHVNRSLAANAAEFHSDDMNAVLPRLEAVLKENADLAFSRIVCPRRLSENTAYHAFVVPVYEAGRLAGLGLDADPGLSATATAWGPGAVSHPYYFRWAFRTGANGDFESLVRLLKPKPADKRVGTRDLDVLHAGPNLVWREDPALGGLLKLGGALRVPRVRFSAAELQEVEKYEEWAKPYPRPFQEDLAKFINLADDYAVATPADAHDAVGIADPDPLIVPPIYGKWHALTQRLLHERDGSDVDPKQNWVHELNLDPRHRVAAGFGTNVVREQQETLMDSAWEQVGAVLEANHRIRFAQLALQTSEQWHQLHLLPLAAAQPERAFVLAAPLHRRVMASPFTVHHHLTQSHVQPALTSAAFRRMLRPRGRIVRALTFTATVTPGNLLDRVNAGEVSAAPPKVIPPGLSTVDQFADHLLPGDAPAGVLEALRARPWLRFLPLLLALLLLLIALVIGGALVWALALAAAAALVALYRWLSRWSAAQSAADGIREENQTPEAAESLPLNVPIFLPDASSGGSGPGAGEPVDPERLREALIDAFDVIAASAAAAVVVPRVPLNLPVLTHTTMVALEPARTIPTRVWQSVDLPPRIRVQLPPERFVEAMAYPVFDTPMYKALTDHHPERFLPQIQLIEQNSITLLETNQKFIEAYMVGLNHEFARELLWREYPTDQRGSYFRQFWDVASFLATPQTEEQRQELREKLRDIPPLHLWPKRSSLGEHDFRQRPGPAREELTLVIRGELLKRYPTAVIYAQRAKWQLTNDVIDKTLVRIFDDDTPTIPAKKSPLYDAKVESDISFLGFDLTAEEALGESAALPDDPGWFFVIKERPGEPRFGLDNDKSTPINVWNDLSWADVQLGPGNHLQFSAATPDILLKEPPIGSVKAEQFKDDKEIQWNSAMSSADMAYILFQVPVLVAVHAREMLPT